MFIQHDGVIYNLAKTQQILLQKNNIKLIYDFDSYDIMNLPFDEDHEAKIAFEEIQEKIKPLLIL